jgi:hypothetical protein
LRKILEEVGDPSRLARGARITGEIWKMDMNLLGVKYRYVLEGLSTLLIKCKCGAAIEY